MRLFRKTTLVILAGGLFAPAAALGQPRGEMTFFSTPLHTGSRYTVTGPRENISLGWQVQSVIFAPGDQWEICTRARYRGDCTRLSRAATHIHYQVASARTVGGFTTLPAPIPPVAGGGSAGPSLRGMTAEFFRAPASEGQRVESCRNGAASCAAERADAFCRARGWTASSYERQETVRGRIYLADVLCTRTGG